MNLTPVQVMDAIAKYMYNTNYYTIFEDIYGPGHHDSYRDEKVEAMKSLIRWWGMLDNEHQQRLVDVAIKNYIEHGNVPGTPQKAFVTGLVL